MSSMQVFSFNYNAYRTETAPAIDGIGNEECWKTAAWAYINQPFEESQYQTQPIFMVVTRWYGMPRDFMS